MANGGIPPWLNINPIEPVQQYLRGVQLGGSLGEARAQQARANQALQLQAEQQAADLAFRREQAAEINEIRRQEAQLNAAKFGLELTRRQQELEREAEEAAQQAEGMRGFEKAIASGEDQAKALMKWAPKMMYRHPERLASTIAAMQRMQPAQAPIQGRTTEGLPYLYNPRTGQPTFAPASALKQGFRPQVQTFGEGENAVQAMETAPGQWRPLQKTIPQAARAELTRINRREVELQKQLEGVTESEAEGADLEAFNELHDIEAERDSILNGTWQPKSVSTRAQAPAALPLPPNKSDLVVGQVYLTNKGLLVWNGTKFVSP